jgi:hypothetical protein
MAYVASRVLWRYCRVNKNSSASTLKGDVTGSEQNYVPTGAARPLLRLQPAQPGCLIPGRSSHRPVVADLNGIAGLPGTSRPAIRWKTCVAGEPPGSGRLPLAGLRANEGPHRGRPARRRGTRRRLRCCVVLSGWPLRTREGQTCAPGGCRGALFCPELRKPAPSRGVPRPAVTVHGAMVGTTIIRPWLDFWPTTALLGLLMLAVLIPMGVAAKRERKELEGQPDPKRTDAGT